VQRRHLLRNFAREASRHVGSQVREAAGIEPPWRRRPPGAAQERRFLELCTSCGDCGRACPHHAVYTLGASVHPGAGTPVMLPERRPCHQCEGFACAAACETGALTVPETPTVRLGRVTLDTSRCLPFLGPECGACARLCPGEVEALRLVVGRPEIDEEACVGCGLCIEACPVEPAALSMVEGG